MDEAFARLRELMLLRAPSGVEDPMREHLLQVLAAHGEPTVDPAGNVLLRIGGRGRRPAVALAAHLDEIATVVRRVEPDGRVRLGALGDTHPWVWGESVLELLGDRETVLGALSFGARHVSEESPQRKQVDAAEPLRWRDTWVETRRTPDELAAAGVRPGTRAILAPARREPVRLGADGAWIAGHHLDDRLGVLVLLLLAERLDAPAGDVELVFSSREEVGCEGVQYHLRRSTDIETLIAVDVHPTAAEYGVEAGPEPVVFAGDARTMFPPAVVRGLVAAGERAGTGVRVAVPARYGSDASTALHAGLVARGGAVAATTDNTHGLEIAHLDAPERLARLLHDWLAADDDAI